MQNFLILILYSITVTNSVRNYYTRVFENDPDGIEIIFDACKSNIFWKEHLTDENFSQICEKNLLMWKSINPTYVQLVGIACLPTVLQATETEIIYERINRQEAMNTVEVLFCNCTDQYTHRSQYFGVAQLNPLGSRPHHESYFQLNLLELENGVHRFAIASWWSTPDH